MRASLEKIQHIVVLMLENRSFDSMVGWLYDPANQPPFDKIPAGQSFNGLSGKDLSNPIPADARGSEQMLLPVRWAAVMERFFEMGVDEIFEAGEDGTLTRMLRDFKRKDVKGVSAKEALS